MKKTIALLALVLAGCGGPPSAEPTILGAGAESHTFVKGIGWGVYRVEDHEAGVVCYTNGAGKDAAISCLPMSETRLGER